MIRLAFRNLVRGGMRSLFTLSGIVVSVVLFVSLTSISAALKKELDQAIAICRADVIVQARGAATPLSSRLEDNVVRQLEQMPGVRSVSAVTVGSVRLSGDYTTLPYLFLFGISSAQPYLSVVKWIGAGLIDGRMFRPGEKGLLLGRLAAGRLKAEVGTILTMGNNERYTVTGIYWTGQGIIDGGAIVDLQSFQALLKRRGYVNMVLLEARDRHETSRLISAIQHEIPGASAIPARSLRGQIRAVTMIDSFISAVSVAAMFLGGLLVLNTLLMAVSERTGEIGLLLAIGWSRGMILRLIVTEALLISMAGGVLGYLSAFPALKVLAMLPAVGPGWIPPRPFAWLFFAALAASASLGGIGGLYPALRATRMNPAAALRHE